MLAIIIVNVQELTITHLQNPSALQSTGSQGEMNSGCCYTWPGFSMKVAQRASFSTTSILRPLTGSESILDMSCSGHGPAAYILLIKNRNKTKEEMRLN